MISVNGKFRAKNPDTASENQLFSKFQKLPSYEYHEPYPTLTWAVPGLLFLVFDDNKKVQIVKKTI